MMPSWAPASVSHLDLTSHKAASETAPHCVHTALLSISGGYMFPRLLLGLPMNATYVDDVPAAAPSLKVTSVFLSLHTNVYSF